MTSGWSTFLPMGSPFLLVHVCLSFYQTVAHSRVPADWSMSADLHKTSFWLQFHYMQYGSYGHQAMWNHRTCDRLAFRIRFDSNCLIGNICRYSSWGKLFLHLIFQAKMLATLSRMSPGLRDFTNSSNMETKGEDYAIVQGANASSTLRPITR